MQKIFVIIATISCFYIFVKKLFNWSRLLFVFLELLIILRFDRTIFFVISKEKNKKLERNLSKVVSIEEESFSTNLITIERAIISCLIFASKTFIYFLNSIQLVV